MALNTDWKEFLDLLESSGAEFLVVGAWARAFYGEPRMTGDIDFWIRASAENASKVKKAIEEFGFGSLGITESDLTGEDQVIQLGFPPRRIDILTNLTGLTFDDAWKHRVQGDLDEVPVNFISREDFIKNKLELARPKDLADVDALRSDR